MDWLARLDAVEISPTWINKAVLDFLFVEGYKDAAEVFCEETGLRADLASMDERMRVRTAIMAGDIEKAASLLNSIDPRILSENKRLDFELKNQYLGAYQKRRHHRIA